MKKAALTLPEIMLIAGTRVIGGVGIGLLLADVIREDKRKKIGWRLFLVGAISTIPLALDVFSKRK
ncbi:hypothetical protein EG832_07895 [bacterium]|nr:hypothetical protein [bacterium]